jgi:hypothetical protein
MFLAKCLDCSILFQGKREVAAASCCKRGNKKSKRQSNVAKKKPLYVYRKKNKYHTAEVFVGDDCMFCSLENTLQISYVAILRNIKYIAR